MSEREELLGRLTELDAGERSRRLTARSIQKMINAGDYIGAATALDDLELALHPALTAGGGSSAMVGAHAQTTFVNNYDQDRIVFDDLSGDSLNWWDVGSKSLVVPDGDEFPGLYIVSAYVTLILSQAPDSSPEFSATITSTAWNFDPLNFGLAERNLANQFIGSVSLPIRIDAECNIRLEGVWGGAATGQLGLTGLSLWRLGDIP